MLICFIFEAHEYVNVYTFVFLCVEGGEWGGERGGKREGQRGGEEEVLGERPALSISSDQST